MTTTPRALADVLRAEHAAVYAYGVLGARLAPGNQPYAAQAEAAHRSRRDRLILRLAALNAPAPATEPAYELPAPVTDDGSALRLAILVEERCAAQWHQALDTLAGADRALAVDALTDCAVRATRARRLAGVNPAVVAFPGGR